MKPPLKTLMERLPDGVDGAVITSEVNRRYFTGMKSSAGTLLLTPNAAQFIIDFRYVEKARSVITEFEVLLQSDDHYTQIERFFQSHGAKRIAVESDFVTVGQFHRYEQKLPSLEWQGGDGLSDVVHALRAIKSPEEVAFMEKAQAITDAAFTHICGVIRPGVTELEVALELEYHMRRLGASGLAFESIVASGVNGSMPHAVPSEKKIAAGDFVTMDFGASYNGYCSDMTRTVAVGKISAEQKRVYHTVLTAQRLAIEAIPQSRLYSEVDAAARDYIYAQGYEGCFGHGLGHSLGLFIHEDPRFSPSCKEEMQKDVIVTVEPGVYLEGKFGVRIEDMVLLTGQEPRDLTHSERELLCL